MKNHLKSLLYALLIFVVLLVAYISFWIFVGITILFMLYQSVLTYIEFKDIK